MAFITVPFDYDENLHRGVVPITIRATAQDGRSIPLPWVERGVVPAADALRKIATRVLNDVWRVSEITEYAVHSLARRYGDDFGAAPDFRVVRCAHWRAEDLRVGGRRARRKLDVELFDSTLEALQDQHDMLTSLETQDMLDKLLEQLDRMGMQDVKAMVPMMLASCEAEEFRAKFGRSRNTLSQRFYRQVRRAATLAGIAI